MFPPVSPPLFAPATGVFRLAPLVSGDVLMAGLNCIVLPPVAGALFMYGQLMPEPTMFGDFMGCHAPMSGPSS